VLVPSLFRRRNTYAGTCEHTPSTVLQLLAHAAWRNDDHSNAMALAALAMQLTHRGLRAVPLAIDGKNSRLQADAKPAVHARQEYVRMLCGVAVALVTTLCIRVCSCCGRGMVARASVWNSMLCVVFSCMGACVRGWCLALGVDSCMGHYVVFTHVWVCLCACV